MDVLAPEDFEKMMEIPKVQPKGERKRNAFKLLTSELSDASTAVLKHRAKPRNVDLSQDSLVGDFYKKIETLQDFQKNIPRKAMEIKHTTDSRLDLFLRFEEWFKSKGSDLKQSKLQFSCDLPEGNGLVATDPIKVRTGFFLMSGNTIPIISNVIIEGEVLVRVPASVMMQSTRLKDDESMEPFATDAVLSHMESALLALLLLNEGYKESSEWSAYIDTLPREFSLPLFWALDDIARLKGSTVQWEAVRLMVHTTLQYLRVLAIMEENSSAFCLCHSLSFQEYLWASAVVMSRQNKVPQQDGSATLSLIPAWDMFNHTDGERITSFFDSKDGHLESFAVRSFAKGEQVYMFYGPRPNRLLLLHQGFIPNVNSHDATEIDMSLSPSDPDLGKKAKMLKTCGLKPGSYSVMKKDPFYHPQVLAFARIASLSTKDIEEMTEWNPGEEHSIENEMKATDFIASCVEATLAQYEPVSNDALANVCLQQQLARTLLASEVELLTSTRAHLSEKKDRLRKREKNRKKKKQRAKHLEPE